MAVQQFFVEGYSTVLSRCFVDGCSTIICRGIFYCIFYCIVKVFVDGCNTVISKGLLYCIVKVFIDDCLEPVVCWFMEDGLEETHLPYSPI